VITIGVDLSYTSTGIVVLRGKRVLHWENPKTTPKQIDVVRQAIIATRVCAVAEEYEPDLLLIEDYAFSKPQGAARLGELGGKVKGELWLDDVRYGTVQPMKLKALAGSGKYDKKQMIKAARRGWKDCPEISDVADAYWAARYARDHFVDYVDLA
jgi:Holliday junction resolvasome RuvABC endonuclease subunit